MDAVWERIFQSIEAQARTYQAMADVIESAIANGELKAGDRLPTQRDVARRLGVAIGTVTRAYSEI